MSVPSLTPSLSTGPSNRRSARTLGRKALAVFASVALGFGLMPAIPAWGAEVETTADDPAIASPAADASDAPSTAPTAADETAATAPTDTDAANTTTPADPDDSTSDESTGTTPDTGAADDTPGSDEGTTPSDPSDDGTPGVTVDQYFPTDEAAVGKLLKKLTARFVADGPDGALDGSLVNAAIALNSLGKGEDIDVDAITKSLIKDEKRAKDGLSGGQYGCYIMMLTAGGIDCTAANIDGTTRNLVKEMEEIVADTEPTPDEAVFMLPVFGNDGYTPSKDSTIEDLVGAIWMFQDDEGYIWPSETAETYSIPLTSQAVLALIPFTDDKDLAKAFGKGALQDAVDAAAEGLADAQLIDGSWPLDGLALEGDVPSTAYATAALVALGADPQKDLKTSNDSTPLGYLTAHADKSLDGYTDLGGSEPVTSATVLLALAADEGFAASHEAFDVYDVRAVERPDEEDEEAAEHTSTSATKTIPQSGDELPLTLGATALIGLGSAAAALRLRRKMNEA